MSEQGVATPQWDEGLSRQFILRGKVYTPRRDELLETFLNLIPFEENEAFQGVELGTGAGWLTEGILRRFANAKMLGLDASEEMRAATANLLEPFGERARVAPFWLQEQAWRLELPEDLGLVVSSLVVHHLEGAAKQELFAELFARLRPGGAVLICDVVLPTSEHGRRAMARAWAADVKAQSVQILGDFTLYDQFVSDRWNMYEESPEGDDIDHPSTLFEQLQWLRDAGFEGIDTWWVRAGHALFGGFKP